MSSEDSTDRKPSVSKRVLPWTLAFVALLLALYCYWGYSGLQERLSEYENLGLKILVKEGDNWVVRDQGTIAPNSYTMRFIPVEKNYTRIAISAIYLRANMDAELMVFMDRDMLDTFLGGTGFALVPIQVTGSDMRLIFILPPGFNTDGGFYILVRNLTDKGMNYTLDVGQGEDLIIGRIPPKI